MEGIVDGAIELAVEIAILAALFTIVERVFRGVEAPPWYRRKDVKTDLVFYVFNRIVSIGILQGIAIALIVAAVALAGGAGLAEVNGIVEQLFVDDGASVASESMHAWVSALPSWVQVLAGLLIADFFGYWGHRFFHLKPFWYVHAVHHSPPTLDWLSSVRFHPIDDAVMAILQVTPLLFLGFDPAVFVIVTPTIAVWAVFSHANLTWDFGPLKYVILTPRFHRWHHTSEEAGLDKNFAGLFPVYDLIFGTWYMPDSIPREFGAGETPVPAGFWRQLLYPFRRPKKGETLARDVERARGLAEGA